MTSYDINWAVCFRRLIVLGGLGVYIVPADGHYWIECGEDIGRRSAHEILEEAGITVNNKIYGGYIEAIETMREALQMAGYDIDEVAFDDFDFEPASFCESRIRKVKKGRGGIF